MYISQVTKWTFKSVNDGIVYLEDETIIIVIQIELITCCNFEFFKYLLYTVLQVTKSAYKILYHGNVKTKEWDNKTSAKYVAKQWVSFPLQLQGKKNPKQNNDLSMQSISYARF